VAEGAAAVRARTTAGKGTARGQTKQHAPQAVALSLCVCGRVRFAGRKVLAKPSFDNVLLRSRYEALIFRDTGALAIFSHQVLTLIEDQN
jgi:hypothetical protein